MTIPTFHSPVRITKDGFKCEHCGVKAAASPGAIMSAYMREVITFEDTHKACAVAARRESASG
jgi:hypothetical protein